MKKIMLCCSSGMSTSLLVKKMQEEAARRGLEAEIRALELMDYIVASLHMRGATFALVPQKFIADPAAQAARASLPMTRWNSRTISGNGCGPATVPSR